jgi:lipid-binding SYLF domain-containing protein
MNRISMLMCLVTLAGLVGCQTAPRSEGDKERLAGNVQATLADMQKDDPTFDAFLDKAYGYVIFPTVGKGGFIVGGSYGKGEVYEQGKMIGYSDISQLTAGLQAGGQAFAEVICFENKAALDQFIGQQYELAAQASAVALKSGAAANAKYTDGIAIFSYIKGGLMAEASLGGQRFRFTPLR